MFWLTWLSKKFPYEQQTGLIKTKDPCENMGDTCRIEEPLLKMESPGISGRSKSALDYDAQQLC